jgi:hypothetical protein
MGIFLHHWGKRVNVRVPAHVTTCWNVLEGDGLIAICPCILN